MTRVQFKNVTIEDDKEEMVYIAKQENQPKKPQKRLPDTVSDVFVGYYLENKKWLPVYAKR